MLQCKPCKSNVWCTLTAADYQRTVDLLLASAWPGARVQSMQHVQSLWNDFGAILRIQTEQSASSQAPSSLIAKVVVPPSTPHHPRGWHSDTSTQRKISSYQVEKNFYQRYASTCPAVCRVPLCFAVHNDGAMVALLLEDLDPHFPGRRTPINAHTVCACVDWLAGFHAHFMGVCDSALAATGTYWYLATRKDEYEAMPDGALKQAAHELDAMLTDCEYKTVLHGDAKVANFCFNVAGDRVAAVDFQYTGVGCGMRDLAYLLGSCLDEDDLTQHEDELLDRYFTELRRCLDLRNQRTNHTIDKAAVELEWRPLYTVAGADFHRFLLGWSPTHQKLTAYSDSLVTRALQRTERKA